MPTRSADARWTGDLKSGEGTVRVESGLFEGQYSFGTRFEDGPGTNPEELLGAAHAGCFAMALSNELAKAGHTPDAVEVTAEVHLDMSDGPTIAGVRLVCDAHVPGIEADEFDRIAQGAKQNCPVSRALAVEITLEHTLHA